MKIAVIGAGNIGGTIGGKWEKAGHDVTYGLRDPSKKPGSKTIADALNVAEVVLLAIPAAAVEECAHDNGRAFDGKIVIDATNNFGGERFQQWDVISKASPKASLYRAFNTYGFEVFANPTLGGTVADLFYAGPEGPNMATVERLIRDVGANPVWVGDALAVDVVDGVLRLWFTLARKRGRRIAFKLVSD